MRKRLSAFVRKSVTVNEADETLVSGDTDAIGYPPDERLRPEKIMLKFSISVTMTSTKYIQFLIRDPVDGKTYEAFKRLKSGSGTDHVAVRQDGDPEMVDGEQLEIHAVGLEAGTPVADVVVQYVRLPL